MKNFFNTEIFIDLIRERPAIWDIRSEEYVFKNIRDRCWNEVFCAMERNLENLTPERREMKITWMRRRWKSLRSSYCRELARQKMNGGRRSKRKPYVYFEKLNFLGPTVVLRGCPAWLESEFEITQGEFDMEDEAEFQIKTEKSDSENGTDETESQIKTDVEIKVNAVWTEEETNDSKDRMKQSDLVMNPCKRTYPEEIKLYTDDDDDKLFLVSLHPHLQTIPAERRLFAKLELMQVLAKYNSENT